ncbi:MAG: SGNH/GDSL hydrolase family protein [Deltaproteobacteria bacterium]|nr:SGNH/GDSL hydrolase family protein [Deltaproteobacteria bacterium]
MKKLILKLVVFIISLVLSCIAAVLALQSFEKHLGADIKYMTMDEPVPNMWVSDDHAGFVNKPHLNHEVFGHVKGITNSIGFRANREYALNKDPKTLRIIGFGDSVTWGIKVNQEHSFLGYLESKLNKQVANLTVTRPDSSVLHGIHPRSVDVEIPRQGHANIEVINAGVIGYSTYQERAFFENLVVKYKPDIAFINFCDNDWLATEDPFKNVRRVYFYYLRDFLKRERQNLSNEEIATVIKLAEIIRAHPGQVWPETSRQNLDRKILNKVMIEAPMKEMALIARQHGVKLVYVFIPTEYPTSNQRETQLHLQKVLSSLGVDFIDLFANLHPDGLLDKTRALDTSMMDKLNLWYEKSGYKKFIKSRSLGWLDPIPSVIHISMYNTLERLHKKTNYVDNEHPSRRGNEIIAERLFEYLQSVGKHPTPAHTPPDAPL